jgi:hypothetical protein
MVFVIDTNRQPLALCCPAVASELFKEAALVTATRWKIYEVLKQAAYQLNAEQAREPG